MSDEGRIIDGNEAREIGASLLSEGRSVRFKLGGSSMFPFLRQGDVAAIDPLPMSQLKLGQVIVFENNGRWIAHRLVAIKKDGNSLRLLAQGDSVKTPDSPVLEAHYLGVIGSFSRNGKYHRMDGLMNELYAKMLLTFRPFPQLFIRFFLKVRNRLARL